MKSSVLVVGASPYQVPLIQKLNTLGYDTCAITNRPLDPGLKIASKGLLLSIVDLEKIEQLVRREKILFAITCGSDIGVLTTAHVNGLLKRNGPTREQVIQVSHKGLLNALLRDLKLNHVPFQTVTDQTRLMDAVDRIPEFPVVLKPFFSSGSRGFSVVDTKQELLERHERTLQASSMEKGYIIQKYIEGIEIGGECLIEDHRVAFLKFTIKTKNAFHVPVGHFVPNPVRSRIRDDVQKQIETIACHLNVKNSAANIDTIVDRQGDSYIIDLSFRLGGNLLPDLMKAKYGLDPYQRIIDYALVRDVRPIRPIPNPGCFGSVIFNANSPGVLTRAKREAIRKLFRTDDLLDMQFDVADGSPYEKFDEGSKRFGHALSRFECEEQYRNLLKQYSELIYQSDVR